MRRLPMNTHVKTTQVKLAAVNQADISPEEWEARLDLAAAADAF